MAVMYAWAKIALLVSLTACSVGEVPGDGTGNPDSGMGSQNEQSFNMVIKPITTTCLGCHSGVTAPNLSSFSTLQAKYKMKPGATNILVTKADATGGQHQGVAYFNAQQKTAVTNWIEGLQ